MIDGLINMLKPPGITSHDLVDQVRGIFHMRRVGHTGTLDPAAAGVVIILLGRMTRLSPLLSGFTKTYRAEITFGVTTNTLDGEGQVLTEVDASSLTAEQVAAQLLNLRGELMLPPPAYSAVRQRGQRLYHKARRGERVEVEPRPMQVLRFDLVDFQPGPRPRALTEIECGKGTYVRTLAAVLGERLGCGAYLSFLVRTRVGSHALAAAHTVAQLAERQRAGSSGDAVISPASALPELPSQVVSHEDARTLCHGNPIGIDALFPPGQLVAVVTAQQLLGVAEVVVRGGTPMLQPRWVLLRPDEL